MAHFLRHLVIVAFSASIVACGGSDTFQQTELPIAHVQASWPTGHLRKTYVIRTETEWQLAWQENEPTTLPVTERPTIDFDSTMVVGVTLGSGPSGCYGMSIRRVIEMEREIRVEYVYYVPLGSVDCTFAVVPLTDFVTVKRSAKPLTFVQTNA